MASRKTYPCFVCQKAGHDEVLVFLDGKDEQGRTKYLNEDGTRHTHLGSQQQTQQQQQLGNTTTTTVSAESTQLKVMAARLEYAISLLEKITNTTAAGT